MPLMIFWDLKKGTKNTNFMRLWACSAIHFITLYNYISIILCGSTKKDKIHRHSTNNAPNVHHLLSVGCSSTESLPVFVRKWKHNSPFFIYLYHLHTHHVIIAISKLLSRNFQWRTWKDLEESYSKPYGIIIIKKPV